MRIHRRTARTRGQALVEFALVIPIFLLLLFGFIDIARYVYTTTAYGQAAREGARYGSVEQWSFSCPGTVVTQTRENCTEAVTLSRVPAGAPVPATSGVVYTCPATCRAGDLMSVKVEGPFNFFTPVISTLLGARTVSQTTQVVIQ
jgi:Flp pilus assembly protein TadG